MEKLVQLGIRHDAREAVELPVLRDLPGRLDERVHGDPRHRAADANAAYAERGEIIDGVAERAVIKKVDRFRGDRLDRGFDLFTRLDTGRIEAIGSGINESLQAADGLVEVGAIVDETSVRAVNTTSPPALSIAWRVALTRLTARSKS